MIARLSVKLYSDMSKERPLFTRYPALHETLPFLPLGDLPTPVHRITQLEEAVGIDALWVKRDDISAGDYGGNKIRKLEFLLAAAKNNNCSTVVTFGGFGSNHALATSIYCRKLKLDCVAILTPEPATDSVRRTLRYHQLLGTQIELANTYADTRVIAERVSESIGPNRCYQIPFGGSSWLGAMGFVNAGFELQAQINSGQLARPDRIYLGLGTAGSAAGLALGLILAGIPTSIQAVQVTPDSMRPDQLFRDLFETTNNELNARDHSIPLLNIGESSVDIRSDQLGAGYAMPTDAAETALELIQTNALLPASLTYTAKTMAALMADAGRGTLAEQNVLFWNTYNSQPYPKLPTDDSWRELPEEFHPIFAAD
jgi:1-aminocyclopropane-1-carboxylate deaminase/D-cysteine desulfhydrase-like pyridoxal-dependent ACC family enzyme